MDLCINSFFLFNLFCSMRDLPCQPNSGRQRKTIQEERTTLISRSEFLAMAKIHQHTFTLKRKKKKKTTKVAVWFQINGMIKQSLVFATKNAIFVLWFGKKILQPTYNFEAPMQLLCPFYQPSWLEAVIINGSCRFWVAEKRWNSCNLCRPLPEKNTGWKGLLMPQLTPLYGHLDYKIQDDEWMRDLTTTLLQQLPSVFFHKSLSPIPALKMWCPGSGRAISSRHVLPTLLKADKVNTTKVSRANYTTIKYATERLTIDTNKDLQALLPLVKIVLDNRDWRYLTLKNYWKKL